MRVYKNIFYKAANLYGGNNKKSLKDRLDEALKKLTTIGARRCNISNVDSPSFHLMWTPSINTSSSFTFGTLMTYTPGKDPLFVIDDEEATHVQLEKYEVDRTEAGKRREVLESRMYFCVTGNHLAVLQTQHLKTDHLKDYINWILAKAECKTDEEYYVLSDVPPKNEQERLKKAKGVKSISFAHNVPPPSDMKGTTPDLFQSEEKDENVFISAIKSLMGQSRDSVVDFSKLDNSNIKLDVRLTYERDTTDGGQALMDEIGEIFRNSKSIEPTLELKDGGSIKGGMLKLDGAICLSSFDGQLDDSEVFEGLRSWLLKILKSEFDR